MRRRGTSAPRGRRSSRMVAGRRTIAVFGVCAAAAALPVGLAGSAVASSGSPSSSSNSVVTVQACPGGLEVGVVGIGLTVGEACPTAPATPMPPPSPTPTGGGGLPPPSIGPTGPQPTEPQPTAVDICTLPPPPSPKVAVVTPSLPPVVAAPVIIPTPTPTPTPKPTPTKPKPTPKPPPPKATPTPVIMQLPPAYHAVPFRKMSPVLVVFVVAIVPVTIARIRHRGR
jgi:hypothetical protein